MICIVYIIFITPSDNDAFSRVRTILKIFNTIEITAFTLRLFNIAKNVCGKWVGYRIPSHRMETLLFINIPHAPRPSESGVSRTEKDAFSILRPANRSQLK